METSNLFDRYPDRNEIEDEVMEKISDSQFYDSELEYFSDDEMTEMAEEVLPIVRKIEPKILKKCFDGWKNRAGQYRVEMFEDLANSGVSMDKSDDCADLFYLGTIYRDYLDSLLNLKNREKTGFVFYDSDDEEVRERGAARGWYDANDGLICIVGDRMKSKFEYLSIVAHEMWHAYQWERADEDDEKADIYRAFFDKGKEFKFGCDEYFGQYGEGEARVFEHEFSKKLYEAMEDAPDMKEVFLAEPFAFSKEV